MSKFYQEYTFFFKKGFRDYTYNFGNDVVQITDPRTMADLGYKNGVSLGEYAVSTNQALSMEANDQLFVYIDKSYSKALTTYLSYQSAYDCYKFGFIDGKLDFELNYTTDDEGEMECDFNANLPLSIGYHDGYNYFFNEGRSGSSKAICLDVVITEMFNASRQKYPVLNEENREKVK